MQQGKTKKYVDDKKHSAYGMGFTRQAHAVARAQWVDEVKPDNSDEIAQLKARVAELESIIDNARTTIEYYDEIIKDMTKVDADEVVDVFRSIIDALKGGNDE